MAVPALRLGKWTAPVFLGAWLAGCESTPLPELPPDDVPDGWRGASRDQAWPAAHWWPAFDSSELIDLIERVRANNLELANTERTLRTAELALIDAGLDRFPSPTLDAGASQSYAGTRPRDGEYRDGGTDTVDLTLSVDYSDVLSRQPRFAAATARYESSLARAADARLRIVAAAAAGYFRILLLRDRIEAGRQNLAHAEAIGQIVRARVDAGTALASEGLRQRIVVRRQANALRTLELDVLRARASLALMVGESVWDFDVKGQTLADLAVPEVAPGLPSELLLRRPDIVQAEAALREARADVDLARLAFLPRISLTGGGALASGATAASVATTAGLALKLFDLDRRGRCLEASRLRLDSLLADYRIAVIGAFNDVEVALADIEVLGSLGEVLAEDVALAEESLRIVEARYREGVQEFEALLGAQDTLYGTRNAVLDNKLATLLAVVDLYTSLGGGWRRVD
ncbi:MAG: TolC family protein [Gammaproteobacteria bacterium]|nr:TolC family protein [Gammaproteobacteria bacterium]